MMEKTPLDYKNAIQLSGKDIYTLRGHNLRFWASLAGCDARRRSRRIATPLQAIGNVAARPPDAAQKCKLWPRKV
jgi:hypothetical protein